MSDLIDDDVEYSSAYPPSIQAGIPKLGDTPKGWTRHALGNLLRTVERPAKLIDTETYQLVTAKRNRGGIVARGILRGDQIRTKTQFYVEAGDFLISNRQISHGACGIVPASLHRAVVSNEYTAFHTSDALDPAFLSALSHLIYFQQTCFHSSIGVHVEKLVFRLEDWMKWEFDIPSLHERKRIVAVLDAWDQAIDQTERLIDAKRRQASLARKLLFSDLSEAQVDLGELAQVSTGVPAPQDRSAFAATGQRFVRVSDLAAFSGEKVDEPEYLTPEASRGLRLFDVGTILFAKSGMSAQLARVVRLPEPAHLVSHLGAVNAHDPTNQSYLYHWLVEHPPSALIQGDGFPSIRISEVAQLPVPALGENHAAEIGAALDSFQSEIEQYSRQLKGFRTQKRGLLQKLLTGEWRLDERFDLPASNAMPLLAAGGAT